MKEKISSNFIKKIFLNLLNSDKAKIRNQRLQLDASKSITTPLSFKFLDSIFPIRMRFD